MLRLRCVLFALMLTPAVSAAAGLPDTGIDTCYNDTVADSVVPTNPDSIARDGGTHPRQDCRYGRDAAANAPALPKAGQGAKGFDYTKINGLGTPLDLGAPRGDPAGEWECTQDNVTGLRWEMKTDTATDLRNWLHSYHWLSNDGFTNGGNAGSAGANTCNATLPGSLCNTQAYVTAVNANSLCGHTDWRLPTRRELLTLVHLGSSDPSIDEAFFPLTNSNAYWTATTVSSLSATAWLISFADGSALSATKSATGRVRLVRGAPF